MSMTVCQQQGVQLQSGFGPWLVEPRVIEFEFPLSSRRSFRPPQAEELNFHVKQQHDIENGNIGNLITQKNKSKPEFNYELNRKNCSKNEGSGGWSFLQALSNTSKGDEKKENEEVYVHPLVKRSASMLSGKSLEMCTESLGSETGSDMSENGDDLITSLAMETEKAPRMPCFGVRKRSSRVDSFPPPLTTIRGGSCGGGGGRGGGGVQVMSEREDGRLVIKAVSVDTHQSCFKAERRDGRLRLHILPSASCSSISGEDVEFDDDECNNHDVDDYGDDEDGDVEDDDDNDDDKRNDEFDDDEFEHDNEVEVENFGRGRGCCKEEGSGRNKEMLNWEPFWVATS